MLTISEIALKYKISYRQVHDLVDYGFLPITYTKRTPNKGLKWYFAETELNKINIPSALAEIKELKSKGIIKNQATDFKKVIKVINYYDRFTDNISQLPHRELLEISFYLFHLNHYAKKYTNLSNSLYKLKNKVIQKMYLTYYNIIEIRYLLGPDRKTIWLCEDCKDSSRAAGMSYLAYIQQEYYCPKCFIQSVEKEYYSLIEFIIVSAEYHFVFHLPLKIALKWLDNLEEISPEARKTERYEDKMYLYGRQISRIEEKVFPLNMIIEKLEAYIN